MTDLSDCRCIACGEGPIATVLPAGEAETVEGRFVCENCGKSYDQVWGVPFLLEYDHDDFLGLIEIAANADLVSPHTPDDMAKFMDLLEGYGKAADREAYCAEAGAGHGPWLPLRYNEWVALEHLVRDEDWKGRKVLDVGAGLGFDSYRHVRAGAEVTALEHSPVLTREGQRTLPMIRWVGGAAHMLPFKDASFDAVFCNAALHHLRNIPVSMREMLRVLRPGGVLITTGDSFRADNSPDNAELDVFNEHADVLRGINENLPRFASFVSALAQLREHIEPRLFTHVLYGEGGASGQHTEDFREWDFDKDCAALSTRAGSLALKVRVKDAVGVKPELRDPSTPTLAPAVVARWMAERGRAMSNLTAWAPDKVVNRPFPGVRASKVELLNGWQAPTGERFRQAYRRGRWYLRRADRQTSITFELWSGDERDFEVLLNGVPTQTATVPAKEWRSVSVDLSEIEPGIAFALEIRLRHEPANFSDGLFRVRRRFFLGQKAEEGLSLEDAARASAARVKTFVTELKRMAHHRLKGRRERSRSAHGTLDA